MAKENKKTLVLGASPNPERYSFKATTQLHAHGYEVVPVGIREGEIAGIPIRTDRPVPEDVHTVSMYIGPKRQPEYYDYILHQIKPKRILFNPGTENPELEALAQAEGIETERACNLVLLSLGAF